MIKVTSNKTLKVFTIRKYEMSGKAKILIAKYRTNPMSIEEFEDLECNTENDWKQFLRTSQDYTAVKNPIIFN